MILNHKAAFKPLINNAETLSFNTAIDNVVTDLVGRWTVRVCS